MAVRDAYELEFEPPQWYVCDHALRIVNPADPLAAAPEAEGDWPHPSRGAGTRKAQEEVLETILVLNLRELLRERVRFLFRGGDYWGIQDITGLDNLGRFHLFELKRDRVRGNVPEQLGTYLLRGLFRPGDDLLDELWSMNVERLSARRWAVYLAAAQANARTSNLGRRAVNSWHPSIRSGEVRAFGESDWQRLYTAGESEMWLMEALLAQAQTRGVQGVTADMVLKWADAAYQDLTDVKPSRPRMRPASQVVIWLVGRGFDPEVYRQVRLWRRAGLDARCLSVDARQSTRSGQWVVCVRREAFPERDRALEWVASQQALIEGNEEACRLDLEFYDARPPSDGDIESGGGPLREATRVVVRGQDEYAKVLFPAGALNT